MVDGKRGRPAMTAEEKKAAADARANRTPEEIAAKKAARETKKAGGVAPSEPKLKASMKKKEPPAGATASPPKPAAPRKATAEEPHVMDPNLLSNDQREGVFLEHMRNYDRQEADTKKIVTDAKAKLAQVRDTAKAAYGTTFLDDRKLHKRLSQPDGRQILENIFTSHAFVARVAEIQIGEVMDLFGEDRTPHMDRMFKDGKRAALSGLGPTPPGQLNGPSQSKWTEGYHAGTAERQKMEAKFEAKKSEPSEFAAHAPPKDDGGIAKARAEGAEAFASGGGSIPPTNLTDAQSEAWVDGFNAERDAKPTAQIAADWQRQGELAFANGEGNSPPDVVPMNERGSWRAGWNKASSAALEAKRAAVKTPAVAAETTQRTTDPEAGASDPFSAGVQHRATGGGGAAPNDMEGGDREEFMRGWRTQDTAMQAQRETAH